MSKICNRVKINVSKKKKRDPHINVTRRDRRLGGAFVRTAQEIFMLIEDIKEIIDSIMPFQHLNPIHII